MSPSFSFPFSASSLINIAILLLSSLLLSLFSMELRCPRARNIVLLTSALYTMLAFGFAGAEERRCSYGRIDKLMRIKCYDMNLREVPQNLKASVEVSNTHTVALLPPLSVVDCVQEVNLRQ